MNITVPIACTLSSTSNTAHTATIEPGIYEDDIGTTTLKAICNDANGFAIYAAGYTGNVVGDTNSTKLIGADGSNNTININTTNNPYYRIPRYNNNNTNRNLTANHSSTSDSSTPYQWYSYGNYYNWPATMANTDELGYSSSENAGTSLCPTSWRLPYGNNSSNGAKPGGFSYLDVQMGGPGKYQDVNSGGTTQSRRWRQFPNNYILAGYIYDESASSRNSIGCYWTTTSRGDNRSSAYSLRILDAYMYPGTHSGQSNTYKNQGFSVRCLTSS